MIRGKIEKWFFPHENRPDHFRSLDGLRGIAVMLVMLSHSSNAKLKFHDYLDFHHVGKVGVYLFFVLSAYLLDRQIAIAFMSGKSSKRYWINYFLRRFLRIFPLFTVALIVHGLLTAYGFPTAINEKYDILLHMALLKGKSVFWSIPVEFKYYFLSPLIMWVCHKYFKWNLSLVILSLALLVILSMSINHYYKLPPISTIKFLPIFLVGTLISIYELLRKDLFTSKGGSLYYDIIGLFFIGLIILTSPFYFDLLFGINILPYRPKLNLPYAIIWGVILISAKYGVKIVSSILEIKFLRFIGAISFSLYLFHFPVLQFVRRYIENQDIKIYLFFLISILVSIITYLLIERPLSKIKIFHEKLSEKEITRVDFG